MEDGGVDDLEDVIGTVGVNVPPRRKPGRLSSTERLARAAEVLTGVTAARRAEQAATQAAAQEAEIKAINTADVQHGVTVGFLAQVFRMDPTTVKKKLRDCAPIARRKAGWIYDLKLAAQYLVTPAIDLDQYLKTIRESDLPTHLQAAYWDAKLKRQKWEENAGDLWRTENIVEVFGKVFQLIKFSMQLWADDIERAQGLTPDQRKLIVGLADGLQNKIHKELMDMPAHNKTQPMKAEVEADAVPIVPEEDDLSNVI